MTRLDGRGLLAGGGSSPEGGDPAGDFHSNLDRRHRRGMIWSSVFLLALATCVVALTALLFNIFNSAFGLVAIESTVDPMTIASGKPIDQLRKDELLAILREAPEINANRRAALERQQPFEARDEANLAALVIDEIVEPRARATYSLRDSLFDRAAIEVSVAQRWPAAELVWRSWLHPSFVTTPQNADAEEAGVRTAVLGSLWTILITILVAFPLGVGAAIYLEEYASHERWVNRVIQTNINNLAGVPSIIYGMLGLAIFVRALEPLTSGRIFGLVDASSANGRTVLSAGLTLALLILPLIIIASQEAIRAVPSSLRQASFGLGATRWQTIWHHVLPAALPGILTGTILAVSRAIGETAPLVVVGASTFITADPTTPFAKFTTLPIQIYQWTARPQGEFRNIAAAAIIVLLTLLLSLNATAVYLRNRFQVRY
jgi:phosphate transport system permease protein